MQGGPHPSPVVVRRVIRLLAPNTASHQPQMELYITYIALAEGDMVATCVVNDYPSHRKLDLPKY
jgi:hypothetical protein